MNTRSFSGMRSGRCVALRVGGVEGGLVGGLDNGLVGW